MQEEEETKQGFKEEGVEGGKDFLLLKLTHFKSGRSRYHRNQSLIDRFLRAKTKKSKKLVPGEGRL